MQTDKSYIALRSHNTSIDVGMIMLSYRARNTENEALAGLYTPEHILSELTILHIRLIVLERVGLNPAMYPAARVKDRRKHPIENGLKLWEWMAEQPDIVKHGVTPHDIAGLLAEARRIIEIFGMERPIEDGFRKLA